MTTNKEPKVDCNFLEKKRLDEAGFRAASSNIERISDEVFSFTQYNFLPSCKEDVLDGHYTFFVNKKNFQYLLYKSSDYGGLTWVIPCDFGGGFLTEQTLPESSKARIESIIADKLLRSYFYDFNNVNQKGESLFPRERPEKNVLICDWSEKNVLICDWSEINDPAALAALKILIGFE